MNKLLLTIGRLLAVNEQTLILATGKSMNFVELGLVEEFDDVDVVVVRINENGEITESAFSVEAE